MSQYKEIANKLGVEGYQFELSNYISQGWKLGLKSIGWLILFGIIYFAIWFVAQLIPFIGSIAHSIILAPALSAGVTYFLHKKHSTGESDFSSFFAGFKNLGNLVLVNFLMGLIVLLAMIPMLISLFSLLSIELFQAFANQDNAAIEELGMTMLANMGSLGIGVIISVLLMWLLVILLIFANQFVILGGLTAVDAIKSSIQVAKKKIFPIFGFMLLILLINIVGALPFFLGLFLTIPMTAGAMYFMFKDIVMSQAVDGEVLLTEDDILDA